MEPQSGKIEKGITENNCRCDIFILWLSLVLGLRTSPMSLLSVVSDFVLLVLLLVHVFTFGGVPVESSEV